MNELIHANDVFFTYPENLLFNGVSAKINSGQAVLVTGANGSGKTTLFRLLSGLLFPDKGQVFHQKNLSLGFFLPAQGLYQHLTVKRHWFYFTSLYQASLEWQNQLAVAFELKALFKKQVIHLSWGQKTKLALALTFLKKAEVYFLDEPFTGLDQITSQKLVEWLSVLKNQGVGFVLSSHQKNADLFKLMDTFWQIKNKKLEQKNG